MAYELILTTAGAAKYAAKEALSQSVQFAELAVGDGGGVVVLPGESWTALTNERWRGAINRVYQSPSNPAAFVIEALVPKTVGGWTAREIAIYDVDGVLIYVASYPETYKPTDAEGWNREFYVRGVFTHSNAATIGLTTDPSAILASQFWVQQWAPSMLVPIDSSAINALDYGTQSKIIASDGAAYDDFGSAVSINDAGDLAVVGAPLANIGPNVNEGAVYTYVKTNGAWNQVDKLLSAGGVADLRFGSVVKLSPDGTMLFVSERTIPSGVANVRVYARSGAGWSQAQVLGLTGTDLFGSSIDISRDQTTLAIGVQGHFATVSYQGAAAIYTKVGGVWTLQQLLVASDAAVNDYLGRSISLSGDGDTVAVGTAFRDGAGINRGAVYVWTRTAGVWGGQQIVTDPFGADNDEAGTTVALTPDGSMLYVGAPGYSTDAGKVLAYFFSAGYNYGATILPSDFDAASGAHFGDALAVSSDGRLLAVGAPFDDYFLATDHGTAYVFSRHADLFFQRQKIVSDDILIGSNFGSSVQFDEHANALIVGRVESGAAAGNGSAYIHTKINR